MKQTSMHHRVALEGEGVVHIWEHLTKVKCHHRRRRNEVASKEYGTDKRSVDHNFRLCMRRVDSGWKSRNLNLNDAIHVVQLLRIELTEKESLTWLKPETRGKKRKLSLRNPAMASIDDREKKPKLCIARRLSAVDPFYDILTWG